MVQSLICPVRHRTMAGSLRLLQGALSVRCHYCHQDHIISRDQLLADWNTLEQKEMPGQFFPVLASHLDTNSRILSIEDSQDGKWDMRRGRPLETHV